jgi:hypothetical protein
MSAAGHVCSRPCLQTVQHHEFTLGDDALELNVFARMRCRHLVEIVDETLGNVGHVRVVLDVGVAHMPFDRFARLALIEHHVAERKDVPLDRLTITHHRNLVLPITSAEHAERSSLS